MFILEHPRTCTRPARLVRLAHAAHLANLENIVKIVYALHILHALHFLHGLYDLYVLQCQIQKFSVGVAEEESGEGLPSPGNEGDSFTPVFSVEVVIKTCLWEFCFFSVLNLRK